eukprot:589-Rhodomonas_salina.2
MGMLLGKVLRTPPYSARRSPVPTSIVLGEVRYRPTRVCCYQVSLAQLSAVSMVCVTSYGINYWIITYMLG